MRDFFLKLFGQSYFQSGIKLTAFSLTHLIVLLIVFGAIFYLYYRFRNRSEQDKENLLRGLVYALMICYFADFFVQEFVYGSMVTEKLPFHICIVTAALMPFAQFNRNGKKILEPVTAMAVLSSMMYLCFPMSGGEGEPWCYQAVQTVFFHGTQLAWGILTLALGAQKLAYKNLWKPGVLLVLITLWAKLGNVMYNRNFFFLEEDAFCIGLVAKGIIPAWVLMIVNPLVYFLAVIALYVVCNVIDSRHKAPVAEKAIA